MELPGICFLIRGAQATHTHPPTPSARAPAVKLGQNPQLNVEIESCQQVLQQPPFLVKFPEYEFQSEFEQK